jgi:hypothetical protein
MSSPRQSRQAIDTRLVPSAAFQATLDLFQTGVDLMRQNLRRRHPEASDEQIDALLRDWLRHRPGAEFGDSTGRLVDLTTRRA